MLIKLKSFPPTFGPENPSKKRSWKDDAVFQKLPPNEVERNTSNNVNKKVTPQQKQKKGEPMVNSPLIRPYFLGGVALGGGVP